MMFGFNSKFHLTIQYFLVFLALLIYLYSPYIGLFLLISGLTITNRGLDFKNNNERKGYVYIIIGFIVILFSLYEISTQELIIILKRYNLSTFFSNTSVIIHTTPYKKTFPNKSFGIQHKGTNVVKSTFVPLRLNDRLYSLLYICHKQLKQQRLYLRSLFINLHKNLNSIAYRQKCYSTIWLYNETERSFLLQ